MGQFGITFRRAQIKSRVSDTTMAMSLLLLSSVFLLIAGAEAGFRCSIGELACTASCYTTLQDSGYCDEDGECICSERPIDIDIEERITELLGGLSVEEWISDKVRFFREQVEGL